MHGLQDIDAAYMLGNSADLDAGLSALLEVPDFDECSSADQDLLAGGMMGMATTTGNCLFEIHLLQAHMLQ